MSSAAEYYVQNTDHYLWEHMKKYSLETLEDGIQGLKYDSLIFLLNQQSFVIIVLQERKFGFTNGRLTSS